MLGVIYFGYDPTYWMVIVGMIISMLASAKVKSAFNKYSKVRSMSGMTGAQVAERILNSQGIYDVSVQRVAGSLTDHYNPSTKVVNLSETVYSSTSVAAIGVAAHECGHAIQHAKGYIPLSLRTAIVPVANIGSKIAWPLLILGLLINSRSSLTFIYAGIICFSFALIFQIVTLPVEFNASARALKLLTSNGILSDDEVGKTRKVLTAAALTYVAAVAASILQLLRILAIFGGRRD
ncbi:zinc metallopeptidase [Lachnospiraceae bacterium HCP1S3_C3]|nr:zinc metallopeptidase [Lachnospiraceae bacterium]MDD6858049.1 zinc metallopeptidase [Lachnospiraceae bacterium]